MPTRCSSASCIDLLMHFISFKTVLFYTKNSPRKDTLGKKIHVFFNQRNTYIHNLVLGKAVTLKDAKFGNKNKNNFKKIKYKQPLPLTSPVCWECFTPEHTGSRHMGTVTTSYSKDRMISEETECKFSYISNFFLLETDSAVHMPRFSEAFSVFFHRACS